MVLARSPMLGKHRGARIHLNAGEGRSFLKRPHGDDLLLVPNVVCASCLSLCHGAAEVTASRLTTS